MSSANSTDSEDQSIARDLEFVSPIPYHNNYNNLDADHLGWLSPINVPGSLPDSFKTPVKIEETTIEDREAADVLMAMTTQSSTSSSVTLSPLTLISALTDSSLSTTLNQKRGFSDLRICTNLTALETPAKKSKNSIENTAAFTPFSAYTSSSSSSSSTSSSSSSTKSSNCYNFDDNSNSYYSPKCNNNHKIDSFNISSIEIKSEKKRGENFNQEENEERPLILNVLADIAAEQLTSSQSLLLSPSDSLNSNCSFFDSGDIAINTLTNLNRGIQYQTSS